MWATITKFINDQLTEDDKGTYCPVRCFGVAGAGSFIVFQGWHTIISGTFDAIQFGTGFAAITAALGTAIGVKAKLGG